MGGANLRETGSRKTSVSAVAIGASAGAVASAVSVVGAAAVAGAAAVDVSVEVDFEEVVACLNVGQGLQTGAMWAVCLSGAIVRLGTVA